MPTRSKSKSKKRSATPKAAAKKPKAKKKAPAKSKRTKTPEKKKTTPTPKPVETPEFEIEEILEVRRNSKRQEEFLVSWLGYPEEDNTWELGKDLKADGHGKVVTAFKKALKSK